MMECKRALEASGGDAGKAVEWLRARGIAKAERRAGREAREGLVECYLHHNGQVGALVELNCETDFVARTEEFRALARDVAMHIAAAAPLAVTAAELPAEVLERERRIFAEQVAREGKPGPLRAKIVEGKLRKFYGEAVLLDQPFVKDDTQTVGEYVKAVSAKLGENVVVRRFARFRLGEAE
jgi:elongation factor Ts